MERIERSEGGHILRNQQVSGSSPELAPSISIIHTVPRGTAGASWPYPLRGCGTYRFLRRRRAYAALRDLRTPAAVLKAETPVPLPLRRSPRLPALRRSGLRSRFARPLGRRCRLLWALWLNPLGPGQPRVGTGALRHVEAENLGEVFASEKLAGGRSLLRQWNCLARVDNQFHLIHSTQAEEKFGLVIEPRADAVQHRRDMLAHAGPVGATARKLDLLRGRKQAVVLPADPLHDTLGQPPLQQLAQRIDRARAVLADGFPLPFRDRRHFQRDLV